MQTNDPKKTCDFIVKSFYSKESSAKEGQNKIDSDCDLTIDYLEEHIFDEAWFNVWKPKPKFVNNIEASVLGPALKDCEESIAILPDGTVEPKSIPVVVYYKTGLFKQLIKEGALKFNFYAVNADPKVAAKYDMIFTAEMNDGTLKYCDMSSDVPTK